MAAALEVVGRADVEGLFAAKASAIFARNGSSNSMVDVSLPVANAANPGSGPRLIAVLMVMRSGRSASCFSAGLLRSPVPTGWKNAAGISIVVVSRRRTARVRSLDHDVEIGLRGHHGAHFGMRLFDPLTDRPCRGGITDGENGNH